MMSNFCKNSTLIVLSIGLVFTQFGCRAIMPVAKNPAVWSAIVTAISAGTAIRAEARNSSREQESDKVFVTIFLPVQQPDNTVQYSQLSVFVYCRDLDNDSKIIEDNNISFEGEPLSSSNQKIVADYIRNTATPICQKKLNG